MKAVRAAWRRWAAVTVGAAALLGLGSAGHLVLATPGGQIQVPTTTTDFFQPGTQPLEGDPFKPIISSSNCRVCHAEYTVVEYPSEPPWDAWVATMMAQAARDPVWRAALAVANQDANDVGEYCIRCHSPGAWLNGRSMPADASGFVISGLQNDFDGVNCNFCHRRLNPVLGPESPPEDVDILASLQFPPDGTPGNGRYVVDPNDARRGPLDDVPQNLHYDDMGQLVPIIYSPFHSTSGMCANCHDVSNPAFERQPDGTLVLGPLDTEHGTQDPNDMFPEQRTYSEWANSQFANGGVLFEDGRFGGNHPTGIMETCQDCHMPDTFAGACFAWEFPPFFARPDMPRHLFNGSNGFALGAVDALWDQSQTQLEPQTLADAAQRTADMVAAASDTQLVQLGDVLKVRVINYSGHKLPTGYPEGRRLWVNVKFYDGDPETGNLIEERGAYDFNTGVLTEDTKVYQMIPGISEDVAAAVNLPPGPSNHLALLNEILLDNRIPPIGFTNAAYEAIRAQPVGYTYEDGQYWDTTEYDIPPGAQSVVATLYHQSMTKGYVEFLRDTNLTDTWGQDLFDYWDDMTPTGGQKAPPLVMDAVTIALAPPVLGDIDGNGAVAFADLLLLLADWGPCPGPDLCGGDLDCDGDVDFADLLTLLGHWT